MQSVKPKFLHVDQIDATGESFASANRNLHHDCVGIQFLFHHLGDAIRVGTGAVHLVDERQAGNIVATHLTVHGQRLTLHATHRTQNQDRPVEYSQAAFNFNREVHVSRCVDQIDMVRFGNVLADLLGAPLDACRGAGNCNSAFLFEFHIVHGSPVTATLHFFHFMNSARVKQDAFAQSRFAGVDVSTDANVANFCKIHISPKKPNPRTNEPPQVRAKH